MAGALGPARLFLFAKHERASGANSTAVGNPSSSSLLTCSYIQSSLYRGGGRRF